MNERISSHGERSLRCHPVTWAEEAGASLGEGGVGSGHCVGSRLEYAADMVMAA